MYMPRWYMPNSAPASPPNVPATVKAAQRMRRVSTPMKPVLAPRDQGKAEGRMADHPERGNAERHHDQGEVEVTRVMGEQGRHLDAGEAIVAAGDLFPLEGDAPHQHGKGERQHGEVDLRQP